MSRTVKLQDLDTHDMSVVQFSPSRTRAKDVLFLQEKLPIAIWTKDSLLGRHNGEDLVMMAKETSSCQDDSSELPMHLPEL